MKTNEILRPPLAGLRMTKLVFRNSPIVFIILANFIFAGNVFAVNSLRATAAKEAMDGGTRKDIARDLKIATDGGNVVLSLPDKQRILENLRNPEPGTIFYAVISDFASDTDTVASAIAEAYRAREAAEREGKKIVVFTVIQGEINDETRFILEEAGINTEDLIFLAEDEVEDLLVGLEKKNAILDITLTDHSSIHAKKENLVLLEEKLDWVIDHHPISDKVKPEKTVYAKVGSTNTLIFERFRGSEIGIPKNLALLMLSAILSDTKNLKVNVTDRDMEAVKKLTEILNYSDTERKNLFIRQTNALNTINVPKPLEKIFSPDNLRYFKIKDVEKYSFITFRLNQNEKDLFKQLWPEIREYIQTDMQKHNLDVALFNLTHLDEEADISSEELYIIGAEDNLLEYKPALRIFEQDKLERVEDLPTGVSVYRLEHKKRFARKETVAKIADYFSYIQAEDTIYSVAGGGALDNLVEKVLEKARGKILEKSYLTVLTISIEKLSDYVIQVIWQFGDIKIRRNISVDTEERLLTADIIARELENIVIPALKRLDRFSPDRALDLRREEDYNSVIKLVTELSKKDIHDITFNFVKNQLLPTMREELLKSKRILEERPHVFLVNPNVFKKGGIRNILRKVAELNEVVNIKIAFYGYKTGELNDILGIENIIAAKSLNELLKELAHRNIEPVNVRALVTTEDKDTADVKELEEIGIRQILVPDIAIPAAAKVINELYRELWDDIGAAEAFVDFFKEMVEAKVILPVSEDVQQKILDELKGGIFAFPEEFKPNPEAINTIKKATDTETFKKFIEEFI